jgi:cold shock CspA family protein/tetratricopeptide (TPR) repeat protein
MEELLTYLREFRVLLILDNLETVLDDRIRELLERLPVGSKILITSRIGIGAFEYPVKLKPMDKGEAILLLRSLANARGVEHLVKTSNKQLEAYCARLQHNPGFIKWFVAAVQSGTTPEAVLAHPDIFLDFCMSNVYGHLDDQSRTVLRSLVLAPEGCSQGELAYVNDLTPLEIKKSLQHLLATNMVSMTSTPRGNSYATEFGVSELARMYLQKHHPVEGVEYASILSKSRQLTSLRETLHHESTRDPYSAYNITPRSDHDLIIIKYLRDALQASRIKDYVTADANVQKAKDLSPDYWEVHRVEAWLLAKQGKIPGARAAYEAAIELAPDYAPLRFWYSSLLLRIDETELALRQLREAQRLDPTSAAIQIELSRIQLYFGHFDEVRATLDPLLTRTDTSERNQRKTWDLYLQAYRREADSQLASQEPAKALGSLVQFRQAYQACPPGLIDRLMVSRLEQARGNIEQCLRMLTDSKVLDTANDLKDWLDCEVHRPPAAEAGIPIGVASSGRIMAIIPKGKYGFIDTGDRRRLFFHCHHLVNSGDWSRLTIGQMVTFVVGSNETGPCAQCVNLVEESPKDVICNGTVNKILHTKGFGFLLDSRGTEWFFHRNSFVNDKAWFSVKAGDLVSFEVGSNEKGVCATKIRCLNK